MNQTSICSFQFPNQYIYLLCFVLSFLIFHIIASKQNKLSIEEQQDKQRDMLAYFAKHKAENEEFFLGVLSK